ncbi:hypothetical protein [Kibdelosporangium philippinense]|uniref:LmrA/YxaF family transcription factor n=1 Tax=Kibdelosporangium philippinense TaxID=211113 RepID=UPI0036151EC5
MGAAESAGAYQAAGDVFGKWTRTIADSLVKRGVSAERAASAATLLISASGGDCARACSTAHSALDQVEREMTRMLGICSSTRLDGSSDRVEYVG